MNSNVSSEAGFSSSVSQTVVSFSGCSAYLSVFSALSIDTVFCDSRSVLLYSALVGSISTMVFPHHWLSCVNDCCDTVAVVVVTVVTSTHPTKSIRSCHLYNGRTVVVSVTA